MDENVSFEQLLVNNVDYLRYLGSNKKKAAQRSMLDIIKQRPNLDEACWKRMEKADLCDLVVELDSSEISNFVKTSNRSGTLDEIKDILQNLHAMKISAAALDTVNPLGTAAQSASKPATASLGAWKPPTISVNEPINPHVNVPNDFFSTSLMASTFHATMYRPNYHNATWGAPPRPHAMWRGSSNPYETWRAQSWPYGEWSAPSTSSATWRDISNPYSTWRTPLSASASLHDPMVSFEPFNALTIPFGRLNTPSNSSATSNSNVPWNAPNNTFVPVDVPTNPALALDMPRIPFDTSNGLTNNTTPMNAPTNSALTLNASTEPALILNEESLKSYPKIQRKAARRIALEVLMKRPNMGEEFLKRMKHASLYTIVNALDSSEISIILGTCRPSSELTLLKCIKDGIKQTNPVVASNSVDLTSNTISLSSCLLSVECLPESQKKVARLILLEILKQRPNKGKKFLKHIEKLSLHALVKTLTSRELAKFLETNCLNETKPSLPLTSNVVSLECPDKPAAILSGESLKGPPKIQRRAAKHIALEIIMMRSNVDEEFLKCMKHASLYSLVSELDSREISNISKKYLETSSPSSGLTLLKSIIDETKLTIAAATFHASMDLPSNAVSLSSCLLSLNSLSTRQKDVTRLILLEILKQRPNVGETYLKHIKKLSLDALVKTLNSRELEIFVGTNCLNETKPTEASNSKSSTSNSMSLESISKYKYKSVRRIVLATLKQRPNKGKACWKCFQKAPLCSLIDELNLGTDVSEQIWKELQCAAIARMRSQINEPNLETTDVSDQILKELQCWNPALGMKQAHSGIRSKLKKRVLKDIVEVVRKIILPMIYQRYKIDDKCLKHINSASTYDLVNELDSDETANILSTSYPSLSSNKLVCMIDEIKKSAATSNMPTSPITESDAPTILAAIHSLINPTVTSNLPPKPSEKINSSHVLYAKEESTYGLNFRLLRLEVYHRTRELGLEDFHHIQDAVMDCLLMKNDETIPGFRRVTLTNGVLCLVCENTKAKRMYKDLISKVTPANGEPGDLIVVDLTDAKSLTHLNCELSSPVMNLDQFVDELLCLNPTLAEGTFLVVGKVKAANTDMHTLRILADYDFMTALENLDCQARYDSGTINFQVSSGGELNYLRGQGEGQCLIDSVRHTAA